MAAGQNPYEDALDQIQTVLMQAQADAAAGLLDQQQRYLGQIHLTANRAAVKLGAML